STIEIDFQAGEGCGAGHGNGAVLVPEGRIGRIAENASEHARARRIGRRTSEKNGQLVDQRSAVGADGRKKLRMAKRKMQRSIAAHGNAGDGPMGTAWRGTIAAFDVREKFLHQKIFVALFSVSRVDIKGGPGIRRCNQKLPQLAR